MIYIKTAEEIRILEESGHRLAVILKKLLKEIKPGTETADLEKMAEELIIATGGRPAFKNYPLGNRIFFPSTLCVSINNEVVHGSSLPNRTIQAGDVVDLDIGMEWPATPELREKYQAPLNPHSPSGGFFTDTCATVAVGKVSREVKKLIQVSQECLSLAIKQVKSGKTINDIARAVQGHAEKHGYGVVRDLVGHGVGYFAHEKPDVLNFEVADNSSENITLEVGMVIAIEPMINQGDWRVKVADNGYTILTADNSLSSHFEHTVVVTKKGGKVITK